MGLTVLMPYCSSSQCSWGYVICSRVWRPRIYNSLLTVVDRRQHQNRLRMVFNSKGRVLSPARQLRPEIGRARNEEQAAFSEEILRILHRNTTRNHSKKR